MAARIARPTTFSAGSFVRSVLAPTSRGRFACVDACRALARMGPVARRAAPRLRKAAGDPDPRVRAAVEEALCAVRDDASSATPPAVDSGRIRLLVSRALSRRDEPEGNWASASSRASAQLGLLGIRDVRPFMDLLGAADDRSRELALDALDRIGPASRAMIPALIPILEDPDKYHRASAAWILGRFGRDAGEALPALEKALRDRKSYVRDAAREAIEEIRGDRDEPGEKE